MVKSNKRKAFKRAAFKIIVLAAIFVVLVTVLRIADYNVKNTLAVSQMSIYGGQGHLQAYTNIAGYSWILSIVYLAISAVIVRKDVATLLSENKDKEGNKNEEDY